MSETTYLAFQEYEEMADKHEKLWEDVEFESGIVTREGIHVNKLAYDIAKFSAFSEGMQLYSSFAMLLNFSRHGKMKSMGQIVAWSVRDESLHVKGMIEVFKEIIKDYPEVWNDEMKKKLYKVAREMVKLEHNFIDLAYRREDGSEREIEGITKQEIKDFVSFTTDRRLVQLGLEPISSIEENPLAWFDEIIGVQEHANFFEVRATEYAKGAMQMDVEEVDW
jgi:ribonucleoside-diphosphate reductase beta chain